MFVSAVILWSPQHSARSLPYPTQGFDWHTCHCKWDSVGFITYCIYPGWSPRSLLLFWHLYWNLLKQVGPAESLKYHPKFKQRTILRLKNVVSVNEHDEYKVPACGREEWHVSVSLPLQRQYHSQINDLIEETVKEMITLLVAKVQTSYHSRNLYRVCITGAAFFCYIVLSMWQIETSNLWKPTTNNVHEATALSDRDPKQPKSGSNEKKEAEHIREAVLWVFSQTCHLTREDERL